MAEQEIYRLDINVGVDGDVKTKKKLSAMDKYAERSRKQMDRLDKMRASPTARLQDKLSSPLRKMKGRVSDFAKVAIKRFAAVATASALIAGGMGMADTVKTYADFEQGMKNVQATTMATEDEMATLTNTAKDLGKSTAFSAKEASDGMNYLAMAGFKTNEIVEAMPGLLDLAAASGSDLATTSDIVSDALTAFGLSAQDTTHLADVMAKASSTANTNVDMLGESFKYAAAPATAFGMSAEETTAALAKMADAGIKGSQAGTALRGALSRLSKPSKESQGWLDKLGVSIADAEGNIKPFNDIMGDMRSSMKNLTQEQKQQAISSIFGQEAMSGMLAVLNTSTEEMDNYTQSLIDADGAAKEMADIKLDTLGGQFKILQSALEGMKIELGERLAPYFKNFVQWATDNVPNITDKIVGLVDAAITFGKQAYPYVVKFINIMKAISPVILGVIAALATLQIASWIGSLIGVFTTVASVVGKVIFAIKAVAGGAATLGQAMAFLMGPVGWIALAIGALVTIGVLLYKNWDTIKEKAGQLAGWISDKWSSIKKWTSDAWKGIKETVSDSWNSLKETIMGLGPAIVNGITGIWNSIKQSAISFWEGIKNTVTETVTLLKDTIVNLIDMLPGSILNSFEIIRTGITNIWEGIKMYFTGVWEVIKNIFLGALLILINLITLDFESMKENISAIWENIKNGFSLIWEGIKLIFIGAGQYLLGYLLLVWNTLKETITVVWNAITEFLVSTWESIKTSAVNGWNSFKNGVIAIINASVIWIKNTWNATVEWFSTLPSRLYNKGVDMFNSLKDGMASLKETIKSKASEIGTSILDKIKEIPGEMLSAGKDIVQGLINGIGDKIGDLKRKAEEAASAVSNKIKGFLGIASPARLMIEYGKFTTEGLALGLEKKIPKLETASKVMFETINKEKPKKRSLFRDLLDKITPRTETIRENTSIQKVKEQKEINVYGKKKYDSDEPNPVPVASGGGNTYIVKIDNIDVDVEGSDSDSDEDIHEVVEKAQKEFAKKLLAALKDRK